MKTKVEALEDNQVKLTTSIDAKEIDDRIKKTYKDFAHKYNFPGFRRGKAPRPIIDNALGAEAVCATVTDDIFKECYPLAVDESGIHPISQPQFENQDELVKEGKPFEFSAKVTVKPEYELTGYDPVEIELPGEEATDEEINEQIEAFREHYFTYEDAAASAKIKEDGVAEISLSATDEQGKSLESIEMESLIYALGNGYFPPEFDKELVGMKKGQKKDFDLEFKGLYTPGLAAIAGSTDKAHFEVTVHVVKKKVLPEVTEEWAKETVGFAGLEDLKTRISESITQSKKQSLPGLKETRSLTALAERIQDDIPEAMINAAETDLLQNFFRQLQSQGATLDAYLQQAGISLDQFKEDVTKQATDMTKQDLALDAWARHHNIEATEEDLTEEFAKSGAEDPKVLEKEWRENGQLHILRQGISRMRAAQNLMDGAVVSEPSAKPKKKTVPKAAGDKAADKKTTDTKEKKTASKKDDTDKKEKVSTEKKSSNKTATKEKAEK